MDHEENTQRVKELLLEQRRKFREDLQWRRRELECLVRAQDRLAEKNRCDHGDECGSNPTWHKGCAQGTRFAIGLLDNAIYLLKNKEE